MTTFQESSAIVAAAKMEFSFDISELRPLPGGDRLAHLQGEALVQELRVLLGDIAAGADIRVDGTHVTVTKAATSSSDSDEAGRLYEKAGQRAHRGEFQKAVGIYRRVLELDPTKHEARRDLAMVLVEMGETEDAKGLLLDVLKVNPKDVAALTILGNHYARLENDRDTAERFIRRAIEVDPEDATAQNSLGGMLCEKKLYAEALAHFNKALELRPEFPQPRYGKAMVFLSEGRLAEARDVLGEMFTASDLTDSRNERMLENARESFLKFTNILANDNAESSALAAAEFLKQAEVSSGFRAVVKREPLPGIQLGRTQLAWKYSRDFHTITLASKLPAEMLFHHILAHESLHIVLESQARQANSNRWFTTTDETLRFAIDAMDRDIRKIVRTTGQQEEPLRDMLWRMLPDALSQLYNAPLDILIERQMHEEPRLRDAQFCSLCLQVHNAARIGFHKDSRTIVPPALLTLNDTLNGAVALFVDTLSRGATAFYAQYRALPTAKLARDVYEMTASHQCSPGSEYDLVDEIAGMLGCRGWYSWRQDPGDFAILERMDGDFPEGGVSNPEKLKQRNAAAVPLMIKSLDRLESMEEEAIKRLVMEAALAGQGGIDYTDPVPRHELKSLAGEKLSGLEVMCILYTGLKQLNPSMPDTEIGMDLSQEFQTAMELRGR